MFPSGTWEGYWEQDHYGRQPMEQFQLHFTPEGQIKGSGHDVVGVFHFAGRVDPSTGRVELTKQYLGAHQVQYVGHPDGEGCILGTWTIAINEYYDSGAFALKPVLGRPTGEEPIQVIAPKRTNPKS